MALALEIIIGIAAFSAIVIPMVLKNPLDALGDYPPAIRERCQELGLIAPRENRFTTADLVRKGIAMIVLALVLAFALKLCKSLENGQVRLDGKVASAHCDKFADNFFDIAVTLSRGNNSAVGEGILNVHILNVVLQHRPSVEGVLAALNEVCGVENCLECGNFLQNVKTS